MKKNKTKFIIIFSIILISLISIFVVMYSKLNHKYPKSTYTLISFGENISYEGLEIKIKNSFFMDEKTKKVVFKDEFDSGQELNCLVVELELFNPTNDTLKVDIYNFMIETGFWANGINLNAFLQINEDTPNASLSPSIKNNENMVLYLPFSMLNSNFPNHTISEIQNRPYSLILSLYPEKIMLEVIK